MLTKAIERIRMIVKELIDGLIAEVHGINYDNERWELQSIRILDIEMCDTDWRGKGARVGKIVETQWDMMVADVEVVEFVFAHSVGETMKAINPAI